MNRNQRRGEAHRPGIAPKAGGVAFLSAQAVQFRIQR